MERVATQPDGGPHNAGGRQGAASAVLRTVGDQQQTVLVLNGRRLPRKIWTISVVLFWRGRPGLRDAWRITPGSGNPPDPLRWTLHLLRFALRASLGRVARA